MKALRNCCSPETALATIAAPMLVGFLCVGSAQAQSEFDVASIRQHQGDINIVGLQISGTRVSETAVTVRDLIMDAYGLKGYQLEAPERLLESPDRYGHCGQSSRRKRSNSGKD